MSALGFPVTIGVAWESRGEISVYSTDLAAAAGDEPCMFRHDSIKHVHDEWPDTLEEALRTPIQLADTGE